MFFSLNLLVPLRSDVGHENGDGEERRGAVFSENECRCTALLHLQDEVRDMNNKQTFVKVTVYVYALLILSDLYLQSILCL